MFSAARAAGQSRFWECGKNLGGIEPKGNIGGFFRPREQRGSCPFFSDPFQVVLRAASPHLSRKPVDKSGSLQEFSDQTFEGFHACLKEVSLQFLS